MPTDEETAVRQQNVEEYDWKDGYKELYCTTCASDIRVLLHPEGGTVLACHCHFLDRGEVMDSLDEHLPERSDCDGPLVKSGELFCHPWEFADD